MRKRNGTVEYVRGGTRGLLVAVDKQTICTEGRVHVAECVTRSVWQNMAVLEGLVVWCRQLSGGCSGM